MLRTFDDIPTENVLNLFLLETTLDDQATTAVYGARCTQLSEQELRHVFVRSFHALADFGNVGEDGLLVAFSETLRWRDLVRLRA
jgi:hypothetical protein